MKAGRSAGSTVAVIGLVVGLSLPAGAFAVSGCRYAGSDPSISYRFYSVTSTWQARHMNGAGNWNAASVPGSFYKTTTLTDPRTNVEDGYYPWSANAMTFGGCAAGGGQVWYNDEVTIQSNLGPSGVDDTEWRLLAVHELGHAYGLAHPSNPCTDPSVMDPVATWVYDNCGSSAAPYADDKDGVNFVY